MAIPLTESEAKSLKKFIKEQGGEIEAGQKLGGFNPSTLSRTLNRRTGPSRFLRDALVEHKIIKA